MTPNQANLKPAAATITIVYDNNQCDARLTTAWGFSCLIRTRAKVVLFDTGGGAEILLGNMNKLGIRPAEIDAIVLSHIHGDHTGGLRGLLEQNNHVTVYLPRSFPSQMKQDIRASGANVEDVHEPGELSEGIFTTGELDEGIIEQSLLVRASELFVIITGCAHPGIVNIAAKAREIAGTGIYLAMGGFHLTGASSSQISYIAEELLELGVQSIAPCHCSGDQARKLFKDRFGPNYVDSGVGTEIALG
jgi:7,8-dihydropterin-6-yl-methyl-4-(beta-D-ribofuranosyl)aminobenzene 5'-phosphate synthase